MCTHCSVSVRILSLISFLPVMVSADTSTSTGPASGTTLHSLTSKFPPKVSSLFAVIVPAHSFNFAFALGTRRDLAQHHIKFRFASQARRPAGTAIFLAPSCHVCGGSRASPQPPAVFFLLTEKLREENAQRVGLARLEYKSRITRGNVPALDQGLFPIFKVEKPKRADVGGCRESSRLLARGLWAFLGAASRRTDRRGRRGCVSLLFDFPVCRPRARR